MVTKGHPDPICTRNLVSEGLEDGNSAVANPLGRLIPLQLITMMGSCMGGCTWGLVGALAPMIFLGKISLGVFVFKNLK